jgi:uncharacterized lipoprotein YmbA
MSRSLRPVSLLAALLSASLIVACGSAPVERFYTLNTPALERAQAPAPAASYSVVLGPVGLPEMVDRPQLVVRTSANRVTVLEHQRWAESLKTAIPRVLAANLGAQLGGVTVATRSDMAARHAKYRVSVNIVQLDAEVNHAVTLGAQWTIRKLPDGPSRSGESQFKESTQSGGYDALVAAHERALSRLSADLAQDIQNVERARP